MAGGCSPGISSSADPEQNSSPATDSCFWLPYLSGGPGIHPVAQNRTLDANVGSSICHLPNPFLPTPWHLSKPSPPPILSPATAACCVLPASRAEAPPSHPHTAAAASHHTLLCWRYTRQRVSPPQTARVIPFPQNLLYPTAARKILIPPPKLASNAASLGKTSLCPQDPRVLRSRLCYKT